MKRPQGFVPPEPPEPQFTAPDDSDAAAAPAGASTARNRRGWPRKLSSHDDTSTEPIAIVGAATIVNEPPKPAAAEPAAPSEAQLNEAQLNERAGAKRVRVAERQRRRYEKTEVRRFTQASRRRRRIWLGSIGGVLALGLVLTAIAFSPLMALRTITVEGASRVPAEQISAALEGQLGTPLPLIDFDRVRAELAPFTLLQSFSTETRPPSTLVVRVVERTPLGSLTTDAGFDLVDAAGVVIVSSAERQPGYPIIEASGAKPELSFGVATAVIRVMPEEMRVQLDVVRAKTTADVTLVLAGGQTVVWGSAEQSALKATVLARLMAAVDPDEVSEYDVSSPNSPVYR